MATVNNRVLTAAAFVMPIDPRDRVLPPEPVVLTGVFHQKNCNGHVSGLERTHVPRVVRRSELLPPLPYAAGDLQKKATQANMGEEDEQDDKETGEGTQPQSTSTGAAQDTHEVERAGGGGGEAQGEHSVLRRLKPWLAPIGLLVLLYTFICSLEFLSSAFRLIAGKTAGRAFSESALLKNPIVALMLGVMTTVLLQSSSTTTSIVVAMVSAGILEVETCVPIVMGANIGTTITSALVSLTQAGDRERFRRAVTAATVHDSFNWLTVLVLLPIEVIFGYLRRVSGLLVQLLPLHTVKNANFDLLKTITGPFTHRIVVLDKRALEQIALGQTDDPNLRLLKVWCPAEEADVMLGDAAHTTPSLQLGHTHATELLIHISTANLSASSSTANPNGTQSEAAIVTSNATPFETHVKCSFLLNVLPLSDAVAGVLLLALALALLISCLVLLVKLLNSVMRDRMSSIVVRTLNLKFPGRLDFLSGYVAILVGATLTAVVQSSSVFTSSLTPMAGLGLITLERLYPLTLGSNIGTTVTGVLAAFAASADRLAPALQIAMCHLLFNLSGVLLFYPLPQMRRLPLRVARAIGKISSEYRWFALVYICTVFLLVPGICFGLSLAGPFVFYGALATVVLLVAALLALRFVQRTRPALLPSALRTFEFLPLPLRSLEPADRALKRVARFVCEPLRCLRSRFATDNETNSRNNDSDLKHVADSSVSVTTQTTLGSFHSGRSNASVDIGAHPVPDPRTNLKLSRF